MYAIRSYYAGIDEATIRIPQLLGKGKIDFEAHVFGKPKGVQEIAMRNPRTRSPDPNDLGLGLFEYPPRTVLEHIRERKGVDSIRRQVSKAVFDSRSYNFV